ncbi:hypothetical protein IPH25_01340 [bacterium]|nr:MAG: hypothetical protein IPG37_03465 [bacterium]QQR62071.1 MAG: hypothetical protein IPH25_01340 [bacterium]QQR63375.1 MAG: hypothetical protein IPH67_02795 [bacterium]
MNRLYKILFAFFVSMQICSVTCMLDLDKCKGFLSRKDTKLIASYQPLVINEMLTEEVSFKLNYNELYTMARDLRQINLVLKANESKFNDEEKKGIHAFQKVGDFLNKKMLEGFEQEKRDLESILKDVNNTSIFSFMYLNQVEQELLDSGKLERKGDNLQFEEKNQENQKICRFIRAAVEDKVIKGLAALAAGTVTVVVGGITGISYAVYKKWFAKKKTDEISESKKESVVEINQ